MLLFKYGGTFIDLNVLLLKPLEDSVNLIATKPCPSANSELCLPFADKRLTLTLNVISLESHSEFAARVLAQFDKLDSISENIGIKCAVAVAQDLLNSGNQELLKLAPEIMITEVPEAFSRFIDDNQWRALTQTHTALQLLGSRTQIKPESVAGRLFEEYKLQ